jgi:hypothetical protein
MFFSSAKLENRWAELVLHGGGVWHQWEVGGGGERDRRVNMVQIIYALICKCKNDAC